MSDWLKRRRLGLLIGLYIGIGLFFGLSMKAAIPATSVLGVAYVAATWPAWVKGSPVTLPVPQWAFSFREPGQ